MLQDPQFNENYYGDLVDGMLSNYWSFEDYTDQSATVASTKVNENATVVADTTSVKPYVETKQLQANNKTVEFMASQTKDTQTVIKAKKDYSFFYVLGVAVVVATITYFLTEEN